MYYARYENLMAVEEAAIFWDVIPSSPLPTFWRKLLPHPSRYRVKSSSCLKKEASGYSTSNCPPDKASHPRRQQS
jgi:hypothetical protein